MLLHRFFLLCLLLSSFSIHARYLEFYAGPEISYLERQRQTGTHQEGQINGLRVGVDRIKRHGFYLGADYLYGCGEIEGKNSREKAIFSNFSNEIIEVRLGYCLQHDWPKKQFFIPFGGWGSFTQSNQFIPPTEMICTFTEHFNFFVVGFLSGFNFTPLLSMGINFKVRFMQNSACDITDDPYFDDITMIVKDSTQYRLELPFVCKSRGPWLLTKIALIPFYELRQFGGRESFPFDYIETKYHLYGANLKLSRCF